MQTSEAKFEFNSQHPYKKCQAWMNIPIITTLESRHGQISGACWLASLAKAVRFKSSERLSQGQGGDSRVRHLSSSGFAHIRHTFYKPPKNMNYQVTPLFCYYLSYSRVFSYKRTSLFSKERGYKYW